MTSPFPGMDPYLELWWRDVHHALCTYARDAIQGQLGSSLRARLDERLVVESDEAGRLHEIYPDVRVVERGRQQTPVRPSEGIALAEPLVVHIETDPAPQGFIQIIDIRDGNRVVTVIEFISPSNKLPGDGQRQYLRKQKECRDAGVNLVEVDLVRTGERVTIAHRYLSPRHDTPYQVSVHRGAEPDKCEIYPIRLQDRLPGVRIPLRKDDPDVALDLQALIDQVYRNAAYGDDIDYAQPCRPPLTGDDAAWAHALLRAAGKR